MQSRPTGDVESSKATDIGAARMARASRLAVQLKIGAGLSLVGLALLVQLLASAVPVGQLLFFRSAGMVVAILGYAAMRRQLRKSFTTARPWAHFSRAIVGFSAVTLNFISLTLLPLAEAQTLMYLSPIFVLLFGVLLLREALTASIIISCFLGFTGVLCILNPDPSSPPLGGAGLGVAVGLVGALMTAAATIQVRHLAKTESSSTMALYFGLFAACLSMCTVFSGWSWPTVIQCVLLAGLGLAGALGHVLMAEALARAPATTLAPFDYLNIVWAVLAALFVFGQIPSLPSLAGGALIVGAALIAGSGGERHLRNTLD